MGVSVSQAYCSSIFLGVGKDVGCARNLELHSLAALYDDRTKLSAILKVVILCVVVP